MFRQAQESRSQLLEDRALAFRKQIEQEFDIDTAEIVDIAYKKFDFAGGEEVLQS